MGSSMNTLAQFFAVLKNLKFRHYWVINREKNNLHDVMAHLVHEYYKITSASLVGVWNRFRGGKDKDHEHED